MKIDLKQSLFKYTSNTQQHNVNVIKSPVKDRNENDFCNENNFKMRKNMRKLISFFKIPQILITLEIFQKKIILDFFKFYRSGWNYQKIPQFFEYNVEFNNECGISLNLFHSFNEKINSYKNNNAKIKTISGLKNADIFGYFQFFCLYTIFYFIYSPIFGETVLILVNKRTYSFCYIIKSSQQ